MKGPADSAYRRFRMYQVQEFCPALDAHLIAEIAHWQQNKVSGDLVEIGVWHGKSFFILARAAVDGEKVIGIDPFPIRPLAKGERQQIDEFTNNCITFNIPAHVLIRHDSLHVQPSDVTSKARLVHVDGAHDYEHALSDTKLARSIVSDGGVIICDDVFNARWPEAAAAFMDWIRGEKEFVPFASTGTKVYLAHNDHKVDYENLVRSKFGREISRRSEVFGRSYIMLTQSRFGKLCEVVKSAALTPKQVQFPRA